MQQLLDPSIVRFIKEHHVMTLATVDEQGMPYCCNLFYAYIESVEMFIFTSNDDTRHALDMDRVAQVAGSIVLETKMVGKIRGLQFTAEVERCDANLLSMARKAYLKAFPYAVVAPLNLWACRIRWAKYTDNRLGFGKKIIWSR